MQFVCCSLVAFVCLTSSIIAAEPADLVVLHGKVITVDGAFSVAEAFAVKDGKFAAVGTEAQIKSYIGPATRVIDAGGRAVVPGLIESHVHAAGAARGEISAPFIQLGSIAEIQDWVKRRAAELPPGAWVQAPRVDVTRIRERRMPTGAELDAAAPDRPAVFVWQYANRQLQILNSAALKEAGITRETPAPRGGKIHVDEQGEPNGLLENAGALTSKFLPRPEIPEAAWLDSLEKLLRIYNQLGITSITERNSNIEGYRLYEKLKAGGRLPVRTTVTIGLGTDGSVAGTEKAIAALPFKFGDGDDWVKVGPLKVGVDGGILYGTAFLREPYGPQSFSLYGISDPQYQGDLRLSPEKLNAIIRTGHRLGWQMSSHVTGDAGVDAVLDAVEDADADSPIRERRYTLIHAYFPNPEAAARAARLGVCVDTQPAWFYKDGDALADALGQQRLQRFIGVAEWQKAGVKVALNSDHMQGFDPDRSLNPFNPFLTMAVAIKRETDQGLMIGPDQRISRQDALRMVTRDAAWLSFDESRKGSIEVGKLADFAILTADPLTCDLDNMPQTRAALTVVDGKSVYDILATSAER